MSTIAKQITTGDPSFHRLLTCLEQIRHKLDSREDDFLFLCNYFQSYEFQKLFKVHKTVSTKDETKSEPVSGTAAQLADEVLEVILPYSDVRTEVGELQHLLRKPHFKGLLKAHDCIATNDYTSKNADDSTSNVLWSELYERPAGKPSVVEGISLENHEKERVKTPVVEMQETVKNAPVIAVEADDAEMETAWDDVQQSVKNMPTVQQRVPSIKETPSVQEQDIPIVQQEAPFFKPSPSVQTNNNNGQAMEEVIGEVYESSSKNETKVTPVIITNGNHKELPVDVEMSNITEERLSSVRIFRDSKETLGVTVRVEEDTESVVVARILSGGLADSSGSLYVGDEILEINGRSVEGMTTNEVADLMDGIRGSVHFKIVPARKDQTFIRKAKISIRAFFDYDPVGDPLIPCKEVGVAFNRGDVLHVLNMEDPNWWQARKEGSSHDQTGLIPSKDFQEKRQLFKSRTASSESRQKDQRATPTSPFNRWKRRKTDSKNILCNFQQELKKEELPAYEQVAKLLDSSEKKRLLLLIGASGVGRRELKKMLLSSSPDKLTTTVPHTSRPMRVYETDGREYFFVSRQTMENFIQNRKFIEFGEYKGCLYGTSKDSIKRAIKSGKTCILKVQPEVMLLLRTADFKPFCVYIKPPPLEELRTSRLTMTSTQRSKKSSMRTFKEEDLQEMINASEVLENKFGHLFDLTVVNKDLEQAHNNILEAVEALQQDTQWVPVNWAQDK